MGGTLKNSVDLDTALELGEDSVLSRLHERVAGGIERPWAITVAFKAYGHGSTEQVFKETGRILLPAAFKEIIEKIRQSITDKHTRDAMGYMRFRLYLQGESTAALVEWGGNIEPELEAVAHTPQAFFDRALAMQARRINELEAQVSESQGHLTSIALKAMETNQGLSTIRGPAAAAADMGTVGGVLGLMVLAWFGPKVLARMLGLPGDTAPGTLRQLVEARLMRALEGDGDNLPDGATRPAGSEDAGAQNLEQIEALPEPEALLTMLKNADPSYRSRLAETVKSDASALSMLMGA